MANISFHFFSGGSVHAVLHEQQLVSVPAAARDPVRAVTDDLRAGADHRDGGEGLPEHAHQQHGDGPATEAQERNQGGGVLRHLPGHAEERAGREHGGRQLRGLAPGDVWHPRVHCVHAGQGKESTLVEI